MELSKKDRLFLSNQYRILEALYPDEANEWAKARKVIEDGFELEYEWSMDYIREPLDRDACIEVVDIMDMFRQLTHSYGQLDDKPEIDDWMLTFGGFDGNNETRQLVYARHIIESGGFEEFANAGDNLNSHGPTLDRYRRQLAEWEKSPDKYNLTSDDIVRITKAAIHPSRR